MRHVIGIGSVCLVVACSSPGAGTTSPQGSNPAANTPAQSDTDQSSPHGHLTVGVSAVQASSGVSQTVVDVFKVRDIVIDATIDSTYDGQQVDIALLNPSDTIVRQQEGVVANGHIQQVMLLANTMVTDLAIPGTYHLRVQTPDGVLLASQPLDLVFNPAPQPTNPPKLIRSAKHAGGK